MADLHRVNLALVGISFLSLIVMPTLWLAFLQILLMWVLKFNWLSMVTPSNLRQSEDSMVFPSVIDLQAEAINSLVFSWTILYKWAMKVWLKLIVAYLS